MHQRTGVSIFMYECLLKVLLRLSSGTPRNVALSESAKRHTATNTNDAYASRSTRSITNVTGPQSYSDSGCQGAKLKSVGRVTI